MSELTGPIMGITMALVSVFLPAAFLPGITGQIFKQFALVIAATSVISAINALTLKPAQCALWLRQRKQKPPNWFNRGFTRMYEGMRRPYMGMVRRMVGRPVLSVVIFGLVIAVAFFAFTRRPTGFLPTEDQGYAILLARLPDAASQPRLQRVSARIEAILHKTPGVASWVDIGGYSVLDSANVSTDITVFVVYEDWSKRGRRLNQDAIISGLNRDLAGIKDAVAFVVVPPPIRGLGQSGGFQIMVEDRGNAGLEALQDATASFVGAGNKTAGLQGLTTTFDAHSPQIYLDIDRTKAQAFNVPLGNVFQTLTGYVGSSFVNLFNKFNQIYQVYIQANDPYRKTVDDIGNLYTRNAQGQMVPLGSILQARRTMGSELITRYNLYPAASVFGSAATGFSSGQAITSMEQIAGHALPSGFSYEWTATSYQEKKVGYEPYFIYALSVVLVFMVLAALYESWTSPAAVLLAVPMALVGVLLGLIVRGYDNNIYTQIGLVLMIALASKNAILVVEFARDLRKEGLSVKEAAIEATDRRFRPIVMTSFAFILGVAPLLFAFGAGAVSQRAIGTVVFGGMCASTLLAIPFVPVFFVLMQGLSERKQKNKQPPSPSPNQDRPL